MQVNMPHHAEDMVRLINSAFGKNPLVTEGLDEAAILAKVLPVAKSQFEIIKQEVEEIFDATNPDEFRDAASDILVTVFGMPFLLGHERLTPYIKAAQISNEVVYPLCPSLTIRDVIVAVNTRAIASLAPITSIYSDEIEWPKLGLKMRQMFSGDLAALEHSCSAGSVPDILEYCSNLVILANQVSLNHGFNIDRDMEEVCSKLLTRLAPSEEVAEATVKHFSENVGVESHYSPSTVVAGHYTIRVKAQAVGTDGKTYAENKFLKALGFQEPVFSEPYDSELHALLPTGAEATEVPADTGC